MGIFTDVLEKGRTSIDKSIFNQPGSLDARDWYREKAKEVRTVNPSKIITRNTEYNRTQIKPGFMYMFAYDPKLKYELPFYDSYPLIFPFSKSDDGFLAMNLHYLPHIYRARLMDALYSLITNDKFDETTRIRASYSLLNSSAKYKYFTPCVKKYLSSHVRSKFLLIPANEWDVALFLPLERFQNASKNQVWKESRVKINGLFN